MSFFSEEMLTLLTREPPDGKEKPEPSKSTLLKMENTLSRKSSKCDLLASNVAAGSGVPQNGNAASVVMGQPQPGADCRSEVTSVCGGDNSSVMSAQSKQEINKRDSVTKDNIYGEVGVQPPQPQDSELDATATKDW